MGMMTKVLRGQDVKGCKNDEKLIKGKAVELSSQE